VLPMSTIDRWLASLRLMQVQDMRVYRDLR
jgi:hypothetical protein